MKRQRTEVLLLLIVMETFFQKDKASGIPRKQHGRRGWYLTDPNLVSLKMLTETTY